MRCSSSVPRNDLNDLFINNEKYNTSRNKVRDVLSYEAYPLDPGKGLHTLALLPEVGSVTGNVNDMAVPYPRWSSLWKTGLTASTCPPWASTNCLTIAKPKPDHRWSVSEIYRHGRNGRTRMVELAGRCQDRYRLQKPG